MEYQVGLAMRMTYAQEFAAKLSPGGSPDDIQTISRALEGLFTSRPVTKTTGAPELPTSAEVSALLEAAKLPKKDPRAAELMEQAGSTPERGQFWMLKQIREQETDHCCGEADCVLCPRNLLLKTRYPAPK
jgi:hypothetical protein